MGVGQVDDGEAIEAKYDRIIVPRTRAVRAPVTHAGQTLLDGVDKVACVSATGQHS